MGASNCDVRARQRKHSYVEGIGIIKGDEKSLFLLAYQIQRTKFYMDTQDEQDKTQNAE